MSEKRHEIAGHRLLEQIGCDGAGGFGLGCLYEAVDPAGRRVALKVASVAALPQVVVKAHNQHPNLIELIGYWVVGADRRVIEEAPRDVAKYAGRRASLVIVMAPLEGVPIREHHPGSRDGGPSTLSASELLAKLGPVAAAVDFLTVPKPIAGMGDVTLNQYEVSPGNIRVTRAGAVFDDIHAGVYCPVGKPGLLLGYPRHLAPECFQGISSHRSVLYSFAVTYHELRTGALPFAELPDSLPDLIAARRQNRLDLSRLPRAERPAIRRALSTDPEQRHASCAELVRDLQGVVQRRRWWPFRG